MTPFDGLDRAVAKASVVETEKVSLAVAFAREAEREAKRPPGVKPKHRYLDSETLEALRQVVEDR